MKKTYIAPETTVMNTEVSELIAMSYNTDVANGSDQFLSNEDKDWNIWGSDED